MNDTIKQRIEQIKNGEVPEGYKKTRAGLAPKDWIKGNLSDILYNEKRAITKPKNGYWRIGIRSHAKGTFHEYVENPDTVEMDELYIVKKNDLIINITFAWEHAIALADEHDDGLLVSHRFPTYVFKKGQIPYFYFNIFVQNRFKQLLANISPGGAGRNRVMSKKDFLKLPCFIPKFEEQKKIAQILMQCDKIIELYQQEIEELKKLKKAYLRKMFPKKGENIPELRFDGFNEPWEQRKLIELVDVCSGRDYKHLSEGSIPVYGTGGYMLSVSEALSYNEDAIGIGRKGTIDKPYILKAPFWTVDTLFYAIPRDKMDLNFVFDIFQIIDWKKKDESTGVPSLSKAAVNDIDIRVPLYDEQQVIGQFFSKIDNLITLHQRKLEEQKMQKKSLMQLLLTGIVRVKI